jgi:hypothetical protein
MQPSSNAGRCSASTAIPNLDDRQPQPAPNASAELLANACWRGDLGTVQSMIAVGCDVNALRSTGRSLLGCAAQRGHRAIVAALLEAGADVNARDDTDDWTPLMHAANSGSVDVMQALLAWPGVDPHHAGRFGVHALGLAARASRDEPIICLLKAGISIVEPHDFRFEILKQAIRRRNVELARVVIGQCGGKVDAFNEWRQDALDLAAKEHCADIVECLLYPGARSGTQGGIETTLRVDALAFLGRSGQVETVLKVCEAKACYASVPAQPEPDKRNAFIAYLGKVGDCSSYLETIAIADLFACPFADGEQAATSGLQVLSDKAEPLSVLNQLIAAPESGSCPLTWCHRKRILMSVGIRLADALSQSRTELPLLAGAGCEVNPRQRAVYHAAALNMLQQAHAGAAPSKIYAAAGLSSAGVERLARVAQCQLDGLKVLSERTMVALAEQMLEPLIPICRQHTDRSAGVDAQALQACLVEAGFLPPLAHAIAGSWNAGLAKLGTTRLEAPPGVTIAQAIQLLDDVMAVRHPPLFAAALLDKLRERALLADFRALTAGTASTGVLDHIFQIQCDQLRQYCEHLAWS